MNAQALKHPRTAWEIEAAMWRAIEYSRKSHNGFGMSCASSAGGNVIAEVSHDRHAIPPYPSTATDKTSPPRFWRF